MIIILLFGLYNMRIAENCGVDMWEGQYIFTEPFSLNEEVGTESVSSFVAKISNVQFSGSKHTQSISTTAV